MQSVLHQYKLRLTNLSQANRSLKLQALSARRDQDLKRLDFLDKRSAEELLEQIVRGKPVSLVRKLDPRDENIATANRRLNNIYREVRTIYEESGAHDLFLGYPFVEGRFLDGTLARCPICLFPVQLERDFTGQPRWRLVSNPDDDIQFNKTFFLAYEKFQQIRLPQSFWETHPDHFPDLQSFLNWLYEFFKEQDLAINFNSELFQFRLNKFMDYNKARMEKFGEAELKLQPHAVLGIFPQSDSSLVQDYDFLEKDPEKYAVESYLKIHAPDTGADAYIKEEKRFFVAPVDQSQEEALLKVKNGHSVVLHGPPGTGKSQVIVNLIADAMATGKKVLVVSQKRAALDVVYNRLAQLGLHRFAALVHDFQGDRSRIFGHIRQQIDDIDTFKEELKDLSLARWEHDLRLTARKIDEHNHFFEELFEALRKPREFGMNLHELYLLAEANLESFRLEGIEKRFEYGSLVRFLEKLGEFFDYLPLLQPAHPWFHRKTFAPYGLGGRQELEVKLEKAQKEIGNFHQTHSELQELNDHILDLQFNLEEIGRIRNWYKELQDENRREDFVDYHHLPIQLKEAEKVMGYFDKWFRRMEEFEVLSPLEWGNALHLGKTITTYERHKDEFFNFFNGDFRDAKNTLKDLFINRGREFSEQGIKRLKEEVKAMQWLLGHYHKVEDYPLFNDMPLTEELSVLWAWWKRKDASLKLLRELSQAKAFPSLLPHSKDGKWDENREKGAKTKLIALESFSRNLKQARASWNTWLHPEQVTALEKGLHDPAAAEAWMGSLRQSLSKSYPDLLALDQLKEGMEPSEKTAFNLLLPHLQGRKSTEEQSFLHQVKNSFFLAWIDWAEAKDPVLGEVSSKRIRRRRKDYSQKLAERQKHVKGLILHKLREAIIGTIEYNRLGNPVTYREIAHQVNKKRRLWSVRKLIGETWTEGLSTLMPCWLASPESVAALFPMEESWFDLVVFDEASQCYVERAFPVMLRAANCVIAGDEKQLPPFDLYSVKVEENEEAFYENEMALEVESVLDLAKNVFSESKLSWHYRSQEEELINFSNHAFYEGRLNVIPPATHDTFSIPPIEWVKIPDGIWINNHNLPEATRIVELIHELVIMQEPPTIGVVTFNYHQQEAIKDAIDHKLAVLNEWDETDQLRAWYAALERTDQEENQGIFVKNIENVQGDERDVILFSVAYAPDPKGKMVSNFGLLSQVGGENRLNVAITRARRKVYVVSSIEPEQLEVAESKNPGPKFFRRYLEYARAVSRQDRELIHTLLDGLSHSRAALGGKDSPAHETSPNPLADSVAAELEKRGFHILRNIGDTNYKLDLAVVDPKDPDIFLLGIECEGPNYFSGKSAKERELYRTSLLEARGWKFHRVWSRNWFLNPGAELDEIEELISGD